MPNIIGSGLLCAKFGSEAKSRFANVVREPSPAGKQLSTHDPSLEHIDVSVK